MIVVLSVAEQDVGAKCVSLCCLFIYFKNSTPVVIFGPKFVSNHTLKGLSFLNNNVNYCTRMAVQILFLNC